MRHPSGHGGKFRFQSPDYHAALRALKGAPRTGATLITLTGGSPVEHRAGADVIAKTLGLGLFPVDLNQVVSKYIGETEKNLSMLLARAEAKNWVLFFDEADALFDPGRQTPASSDRYATIRGGLVTRLEAYRGTIVAVLRHPPPPWHVDQKIRRVQITFPPA